ncbi:MAG: 50S ribosomal protein L6 [Bacilli bacterium]|nr:50S ribosomal protein L6 [Bacilli bacterium]
MSRIGNKTIQLEVGVSVNINPDNFVEVKGPKGTISRHFSQEMTIKVEDNHLLVARPSDAIRHKALHGTTRALLNNMVHGVTEGFLKVLEIQGTGYRASLSGNKLVINAGYSHPVELIVPEGLKVVVPSPTAIEVSGVDYQAVGQFAAEIRSIRKPEPYLGKGIRYKGEAVRRKEGKKAK